MTAARNPLRISADDLDADGHTAYTIVTANAASADPAYDGTSVPGVAVTNSDNESSGTDTVGGRAATAEVAGLIAAIAAIMGGT